MFEDPGRPCFRLIGAEPLGNFRRSGLVLSSLCERVDTSTPVMKLTEDHTWVFECVPVCNHQLENSWQKVLEIRYITQTNNLRRSAKVRCSTWV